MNGDLSKYIQRKDCTEDEVNTLMGLGYKPFAITPVSEELIKNGVYRTIESHLVYHFILNTKEAKK